MTPFESLPYSCVIIPIVSITTWAFEQPVIGLPIMREGFITTTGFLQSATLLRWP